MKQIGIILIGLSVAIVTGVVVYIALGGVSDGPAVETADEFLDSVGDQSLAKNESQGSGLLPGDTGNPARLPMIEVETNDYDIGIIASDRIADGQVTIYNRGEAPLVISNIKTTCGCTKGRMDITEIAPGKSAQMLVTVDPARIPGFYSKKTLTISSNDPRTPQVTVDVTANVEPEIEWEPEILDFGKVAKGSQVRKTLRIRQLNDEALELTTAVMRRGAQIFTTEIEPVPEREWKVPGKHEYDVVAYVNSSAPLGNHQALLSIGTNLKRLRQASIQVRALIEGSYEIIPSYVNLQSVKPGDSFEGVLKITSVNPLEIVSIESNNDNLTVTHRPGPVANSYLLDVAIGEASGGRIQRDTWDVKIKTNDREFVETIRVFALMASDAGSTDASSTPIKIQSVVKPLTQEQLSDLRKTVEEAQKKAAEKAADTGDDTGN